MPSKPAPYLANLPARKDQTMPPVSPPKPGPVQDADDTQRGRWGGAAEREGRRLEARFLDSDAERFYFDLTVSSTDGSRLQGPVRFHLHNSYEKSVRSIKIRDQARAVSEPIVASETYTVGAQ